MVLVSISISAAKAVTTLPPFCFTGVSGVFRGKGANGTPLLYAYETVAEATILCAQQPASGAVAT